MVRATTTNRRSTPPSLFAVAPILCTQRLLWVSLLLSFYCVVDAFVAMPPSAPFTTAAVVVTEPPHHHHIPSRLLVRKNDSGGGDPWAHNKARTDVRNFLTQRAMQSFVFLLGNCRDQATVRWLETTFDFHNLEAYHGTAAFNLTTYPKWDDMLMDMLTRPSSVIVIQARRRGRGHGGWSKNNPFLEERFVEYEIDIEPPSLVSRIVSVREQIAGEWLSDLQTLRDVNEMILDAYYKTQDEQRSSKESSSDNTLTGSDDDTTTTTQDDALDSVPTASSSSDAERKAYDRGAMMVLGNHIFSGGGGTSSPFRKSSFDLLGLLATQESIHRVLREYREEERSISFVWLRDFYVARLASHFDGAQPYGRADDFLGALLLQAPSMKQLEKGHTTTTTSAEVIGLIDPHRIAEDIITMRSVVVQEWRDTMTEVLQTDHAELRKCILTVQMDRRLDETSQYVEEQTSFYEQGFQ